QCEERDVELPGVYLRFSSRLRQLRLSLTAFGLASFHLTPCHVSLRLLVLNPGPPDQYKQGRRDDRADQAGREIPPPVQPGEATHRLLLQINPQSGSFFARQSITASSRALTRSSSLPSKWSSITRSCPALFGVGRITFTVSNVPAALRSSNFTLSCLPASVLVGTSPDMFAYITWATTTSSPPDVWTSCSRSVPITSRRLRSIWRMLWMTRNGPRMPTNPAAMVMNRVGRRSASNCHQSRRQPTTRSATPVSRNPPATKPSALRVDDGNTTPSTGSGRSGSVVSAMMVLRVRRGGDKVPARTPVRNHRRGPACFHFFVQAAGFPAYDPIDDKNHDSRTPMSSRFG